MYGVGGLSISTTSTSLQITADPTCPSCGDQFYKRSMAQQRTAPISLLDLFPKEWPQGFAETREIARDQLCLEAIISTLRSLNEEPEGDESQLFMASYDDGSTSYDIQEAIRFIQTGTADDLRDQNRTRKNGTAWLDDRTRGPSLPQHLAEPVSESTSDNSATRSVVLPSPVPAIIPPCSLESNSHHECDITDIPLELLTAPSVTGSLSRLHSARSARVYPAPLTASDLYRNLREKQFGHTIYQDADRRLVHVADPDAHDFLALIRTARTHQQASLHGAICSFLAMNTSIKVMVNGGHSTFQLDFHIPYFAVRRSQPESDYPERKKRTHRGWMNINFLDTKHLKSEEQGTLGLQQAHISVSLCGTENTRWTAYCFEDKFFEEDGAFGDDEQTEVHQSDQIARGEFGGEDTIWDAREYYLCVFLVRMRQVLKEWVELMRLIESSIMAHSWGRFFFSATRNGIPTTVNDNAASAWIDSAMPLLGKLLGDIAKTNDAWKRFISPNGDLGFFSDTSSNPKIKRTLNQLSDTFDHMQDLEKILRRIAEQCETWAQTVNLRLNSDNTRNAQLTVFFISPFAIVSTFFSIPVPIMAFDRNFASFSVALLLYTVVLQALLYFWGGRIWWLPWWAKLSQRAKAVWNRDPCLTTKNGARKKVSQRIM